MESKLSKLTKVNRSNGSTLVLRSERTLRNFKVDNEEMNATRTLHYLKVNNM